MDLRSVEEFLSEANRFHPAWIKSYPSLKDRRAYLRQRRSLSWNLLKADPAQARTAADRIKPGVQQVIGENKAAQKSQREAEKAGYTRRYNVELPHLKPRFDAMSEVEKDCRFQAEMELRFLLTEPARSPCAEVDYLLPRLASDIFSRGNEWAEFWFGEVELSRMLTTHASVLVQRFQRQRRVTAGNTLDRIHAGCLVSHDALVTADKSFFEALEYACQQARFRAKPLFVRRSQDSSPLDELRRACNQMNDHPA